MTAITRKSDGRRIFSESFKRKQVERLQRGDHTVAALGRRLGVARSLLHRWIRLANENNKGAAAARRRSAPLGKQGTAQYIRELQTLIGKQLVELEQVRAELDALQKRRRSPRASRRKPA